MAWLYAQGVAYAYADSVFSDVTFRLDGGIHGLVGANGSGKSTLLAVLAGLPPTEGIVRRSHAVVTCPQTFADADRSAGEMRRLQIETVLRDDPAILFLDEPTNHIDARTRDWLVATLRRSDALVVVVSHDRAFLDALTQSTLRLHAGRLEHHAAPYSQARAQWDRADRERREARHAQAASLRRAEVDLQRRRESVRSTSLSSRKRGKHDSDARTLGAQTVADWGAAKATRGITLARRDVEKQRAALPAFEVDTTLGRSVFIDFERPKQSRLVTHGRLVIERDTRVRITGENGSGKSTLFAAARNDAGLWLPQELSDETEWRERLRTEDRTRWFHVLAALGMSPVPEHWSPGELRKIAIAWGLARQVPLVALDEPTNHLDLPSIEKLEAALGAYPGALLLITHDDAFARNCRTTDVPLSSLVDG